MVRGPRWVPGEPGGAVSDEEAGFGRRGVDEYRGDVPDDAGAGRYRGAGDRAGDPLSPETGDTGRNPLDAGRTVRFLRAVSGSVAIGLVIVAVGIVVVSILGGRRGFPGPGTESLVVHLVAAGAVLLLQRISDRRRGVVAAAASLAVFVVTGAVLWTQWWG